MGRLLPAILTLPLLLVLGGCSQPRDEVLRMGLATAPVMLDPRFATDAASTRINRLLYRRLVAFDAQSRPIPSLADWRRISPLRYRFLLKPEIPPFVDGHPLTAQDVKATYDSMLDPAAGSPHRATLDMIERIETPGVSTVDFFLNRPDSLFPAYLTIGILPAALIKAGHPFQARPIGNGAFRLIDWPEAGRLLLERRSDAQRIELLQVRDPTVRVLKLQRGEIDMLQNDIPPELIRYLGGRDKIKIMRKRGSNFSYLGFNLRDPVTSDLLVRRAIAHAIDRQAIIDFVMAGAAEPAQALFPPEHWAGAGELEPYPHAPELARRLLLQAGYDAEHPLRLSYKTSSDPFRVRLATIIQDQLRRVGIQVALHSYDWGTFYGDIKAGRFQMYSLAWVGVQTPDIFRYVFHSRSVPPEGANRGRFASSAVDRLIEAAETKQHMQDQTPVYRALAQQLLQELPYVPLWYEDQVVISRSDVEGYSLAVDGNYDGLAQVRRKNIDDGSSEDN